MHNPPDPRPAGVVGPNTVIQLARALEGDSGPEALHRVFDEAGCSTFLQAPPCDMIDQAIPARLFASLWSNLPDKVAGRIAADAGQRTARYIVENRIPPLVRFALRTAPRSLARRLLLRAIVRNAWTFAGSGHCTAKHGDPTKVEIIANPIAMPDCVWHKAVFAELFKTLIGGPMHICHTDCCLRGAAACRFELTFAPGR
jgi:divinyl protochlorophyllide a 8-vinyl-reductase